jgi:hypothetical protein
MPSWTCRKPKEDPDAFRAPEDYILAEAVWREALARWPGSTIILRQGARIVHDSRRPRVVK